MERKDLKPCTMKMACEHISKANILLHTDGTPLEPLEIYNYSPSGELSMIFELYPIAVNILGYEAT